MATLRTTYVLDRRGVYQPPWLDDSDLDDDPPSPEWPFDHVPGARAIRESSPGTLPGEPPATALAPARRAAAASAMAIAAAMVVTFGVGWWVGQVHPPRGEERSLARTVRSPAKSVRAEAEMAPALVAIARIPQASPPAPVWRSSPVPAPFGPAAPLPSTVPLAPVALAAREKPTKPLAPVFVPTDL
jgi:hypothetical protein